MTFDNVAGLAIRAEDIEKINAQHPCFFCGEGTFLHSDPCRIASTRGHSVC